MRFAEQSNTGGLDRLKVLLVSHNPITTYHNMGKSFLALFSAFEPEELCQLYLYPTVPDTDCCGAYYRFTDMDALHSLLDRHRVGESVVSNTQQHLLFENAAVEQIYRAPRNRTSWMRFGRDIVWKLSNWNNAALDAWIDKQSPDLVFAAVGKQEMLYDMAMTIAKQHDIPLVSYVCDDYYYSGGGGDPLQKLQKKRLRRKIEELMRSSALTITICRELTDRYAETFGVKAETVMTCPTSRARPYVRLEEGVRARRLVYMGNISIGRELSLLELGEVLHETNQAGAVHGTLEIYTGEKNQEALDRLSACPAIRLHGFVTGREYEGVFDSADVFVHVESFDEKNRERVRYSISTKIIECLASGRPLLAYGPGDVASMAYLRRHHCAVLAQSRRELPAAVEAVLTQEDLRQELVRNAAQTVQREAGNSRHLYELLEGVLRESV